MEKILKINAATRQLNSAITILFQGGDCIASHTLAIAASNIYADILDKKIDCISWREKIRTGHNLSKKDIKHVMHNSWNFFKHADNDSEGTLDFDKSESLYFIFYATLECGELQENSIQMQVFQLWFLALDLIDIGNDNEIQLLANSIFPDLKLLTTIERLKLGEKMLSLQIDEFETKN